MRRRRTPIISPRGLSLSIMQLVMLFLGARRVLAGLLLLTVLNGLIDLVADLVRGDFLSIPIPLVFVIVFLLAASRLTSRPLWRAAAWRDATGRG